MTTETIQTHPEPEGEAPPSPSPIEALQRRFDTFKPKTPDPNLHRDLRHVWLLPALLSLDSCLWQRWDYWLLCHEYAQEHEGELPEAPIPPLDPLSFPHAASRKMLEASLNCIAYAA